MAKPKTSCTCTGGWHDQRKAADIAKLKQARILAARLVGGDPSNAPINHPIRWPGSWHRKAEPRLCVIDTLNADIEIELGEALALLSKAVPAAGITDGSNTDTDNSSGSDEWPALVGDIVSGKSYHAPLVSLAARLVGSNMHDGTAVKLLRGLMAASSGPRDDRWHSRYDAIPRYVNSARDKFTVEDTPQAEPNKTLLVPYATTTFAGIPCRQWLHAGHYIRGQVVMTVAPGGYGKTTLIICNALEMATGRGLIGPAPPAAADRDQAATTSAPATRCRRSKPGTIRSPSTTSPPTTCAGRVTPPGRVAIGTIHDPPTGSAIPWLNVSISIPIRTARSSTPSCGSGSPTASSRSRSAKTAYVTSGNTSCPVTGTRSPTRTDISARQSRFGTDARLTHRWRRSVVRQARQLLFPP